ncbi:hypothetical protein G4B88_028288 [Cannabis sativa]|uniref:Uncharacterized protein n=1 Tax=Cannabis sativa TaxID=3483 RepID=A0A7J6EA98_CANSA|nr:hypothetical protein G4B88_028288 [Cannabis sativa]
MEIMLEEKLSSSKLKASSHIESQFGVDYNTIGGGDDEEIDEFDGVSHTQQPINMRRKSTGSTTSNQ